MIVFDLQCGGGHRFEGWFASAEDFGAQRERGLIGCPKCGSVGVERVPSATRINMGAAEPAALPEGGDTQRDPRLAGKDPFAIAQMLYSRLVDEILTKTEDVGTDFPAEARRIHYDEAPARAIRGQASKEEHDALVDEGIPVARLPLPPGRPN
jgi:hypothetical protein